MDLRSQLGELWPHFSSDDLDTIAALFEGLEIVELADNAQLFGADEATDDAWVVLTGSIDEWVASSRAAVRQPGQFVGEVALLAGTPQTTTAEGRTDCLLLVVPRAMLSDLTQFPSPFTGWFVAEVSKHATEWSTRSQASGHYGQLQTYPYCNRMTFPGPYKGVQCELLYLFCKRSDQEMELATPPGVDWLTGTYMICAARYPDFRAVHALQWVQMKYQEVSIMVPAWVEGQLLPSILIPYIYVDAVQPLIAGREVFGYPKMQYPVAFDSDLGLLDSDRFLVRKDGQNVVRATYQTIAWQEADPDVRGQVLERWLDPLKQKHADHQPVIDAARGDDPDWLIELFNSLPEALRTLGVSTWKRTFNPDAYLTSPGPIAWKPEQFQVDGVAGSKFVMSSLSQIDFVVPTDFIALDGFIDHAVELEFPLGLRVVIDLDMVPAAMQRDYLADPPTRDEDLRKMMWGPRAWAHMYGLVPGTSPETGDAASAPEPSPPPARDPSEELGS